MGLFSFVGAGIGLLLVGVHEAIASSSSIPKETPNSFRSSAINSIHLTTQSRKPSFKFVFTLASMFIIDSFLSLIHVINSSDGVGFANQLQVLSVEFLFLLYSLVGGLSNFSDSIPLLSSLVSFIALFAFGEEFLLFYLQRKDTDGVENRYYDHMLVPISICFFSTVFELKYPKWNVPRLSRGIGLIFQGTWFVQMGVSFFTGLLAQGCSLNRKSRGNYTIECEGHPDYHRAKAIATLQFNCHLALLVTLIVGAYSVICQKNAGYSQYRTIAEMQSYNLSHFTLDSDDDNEEEIIEERNVA